MTDSDSDMIPDLIGSSESEEEDEWEDVAANNDDCARFWLNRNKDLPEHHKVIKIFALGPFLFGIVDQPEHWISFLSEVDLIPETPTFNIEPLEEPAINRLDIIESAIDVVIKGIVMETDCYSKQNILKEVLDLMELTDKHKAKGLDEIIRRSSGKDFIKKWREQVIIAPGMKNPGDKVVVAILFACQQYAKQVWELTKENKNKLKEFEESKRIDDKRQPEKRERGNEEFKKGNYSKAISLYTHGLYISPFNLLLYSNRAQSYLRSGHLRGAMSDGRRCIVLNPQWAKGHFRYASALLGMEKLPTVQKAQDALRNALKYCPKDKDILLKQREVDDKLRKMKKKEEAKRRKQEKKKESKNAVDQSAKEKEKKSSSHSKLSDAEDDDCPALTSSSEDEDLPKKTKSKAKNMQRTAPKRKTSTEEPPRFKSESDEVEKQLGSTQSKKDKIPQNVAKEKLKKNEKQKEMVEKLDQKTRELQKKLEKKSTNTSSKNEMKPTVENKLVEKERRYRDLETNMRQGSEAFLEQKCRNAVWFYQKAVDLIKQHPVEFFPPLGEVDYVVLLYAMGTACVDTGMQKEIVQGIAWFEKIIENHKSVRFPLAYLGLGKAYHKQNRFQEALQPLDKGLSIVSRIDISSSVLTWPMSQHAIEDSHPKNLQSALQSLIVKCKFPPPSDAVCRYEQCSRHYSVKIYVSDPDFKGFIRIICFAKCILEFHIDCWKNLKSLKYGKLSDREILSGKECFTPDCPSLISKITVFDHDGQMQKEMAYEGDPALLTLKGPPKKHIKMKSTSQKSVKKKEEQKILRLQKKIDLKQKNKEETNSAVELIGQIESAKLIEKSASTTVIPTMEEKCTDHFEDMGNDVDLDMYVTVLKKGEASPEQMYRAKGTTKCKRKKKKKDHTKSSAVSLQEFVGHADSEEHSNSPTPVGSGTNIAGIFPVLDVSNPFAVPNELKEDIAAFEHKPISDGTGYVPSPSISRFQYSEVAKKSPESLPAKPDHIQECDLKALDIKETLFSFFAGILQENGPLHISNDIIQRELEEFPEEAKGLIDSAGGIGKFLIQSLQFAMIDEFVCLMQDTIRARELVEKHRMTLVEKYREQSPLKTSKRANKKLSPSQFPPMDRTVLHSVDHSCSSESVNSGGSISGKDTSVTAGIAKAKPKLSFTTIANSVMSRQNALPSPSRPGQSTGSGSSLTQTITTPSPKHNLPVSSPKASGSGKSKKGKKSKATSSPASSVSDSKISQDFSKLQQNLETSSLGELAEALKFASEKEKEVQQELCQVTEASLDEKCLQGSCNVETSEVNQPAASVSELFRRQVYATVGKDPLQVVEKEKLHKSVSPASVTSNESSSTADSVGSKLGAEKRIVIKRPTIYNTGENEIYKFNLKDDSVEVRSRKKATDSSQSTPTQTSDKDGTVPSKSSSFPGTPVVCSSMEAEQLRKLDKVKDLWKGGIDKKKGWQSASRPWGDEVQKHFTPPELKHQNDEFVDDSRAPEQGHSPDNFSSTFIQTGSTQVWGQENTQDSSKLVSPKKDMVAQPQTWPTYEVSPIGSSPKPSTRLPLRVGLQERDSKQRSPSPQPPLNCMPSIHSSEESLKNMVPFSDTQSSLIGSGIHLKVEDSEETEYHGVWNMDSNRPDPAIDPPVVEKDLFGVEESAALEIKRIDDMFCREQAKLVQDSWNKCPAFRQNPCLMDKAMEIISNDLSKASAKRANSGFSKRELPIGSPMPGKTGKHKSKSVQCEIKVSMVDCFVSTDPVDEPYREQLEIANHNIMLLQQRIQQEMDKNVQMGNITSTEISVLGKQRDDLLVDCQNFDQFNKNLAKDFESESRKWAVERKKYSEEIKTIKEQMKETEAQAEQINAKAVGYEHRLAVMSDMLNQEREEMNKERADVRMQIEPYEQRLSTALSRAENAEISLLQLKLEVGMQILDRSLKDAEMYATQLGTQVRKLQTEKQPVPQPLHEIFTKWIDTAKVIKRRKSETKTEFEDFIQRIRQGESLSNMPPIPIPQPPPAPDFPFVQLGTMMRNPQNQHPGVAMRSGFPVHPMGSLGAGISPPPPSASPHQVPPSQAPPANGAWSNGAAGNGVKNMADDLLRDYAAQMAAARLSDAQRPKPTPTNQPKAAKSGYEKILNALEKMFPNYSRMEISKFVQDFRNSRAQSLSGLALSDIVQQVADTMLRDQQAKSQVGASLRSKSAVNPVGEEIFQEEEDPCIICHEDLPASRLEAQLWSCDSCSHTYHLNCMKMWLREQSTCPTCRMHVLLNEEFPALA